MDEIEIGYTLRGYIDGDENNIVPLLKKAFGEWPFYDIDCTPEEHWNWRYNNSEQNAIVSLVEKKNRIIACGHNTLSNIKIRDFSILSSYGTDMSVHPDFQGEGLYSIVTEHIDKIRDQMGAEFRYMITVNPKLINSNTRKQYFPYIFPHRVNYLTKIFDVEEHAVAKGLKPSIVTRIKQIINSTRTNSFSQDEDKNIVSINRFDEKIDQFLLNIAEKYDFMLKMSSGYLNWRYLDHRGGNYVVRAYMEDRTIEGFAVYRINKKETYPVGYIVELLASENRLDLAERLVNDGLKYFKNNNVNQVNYQIVENHPFEEIAKKYGFYGGEGNRHFFYNYIGNRDLDLDNIDPRRVHFTFGALTGI